MSLRDILKMRYIHVPGVLGKKNLLTDQEYAVISSTKMQDLLKFAFNPRVLNIICLSEQTQLVAHCDYMEICHERKIQKIQRRLRSLKPRRNPTTVIRDVGGAPRSPAAPMIVEMPAMANVLVAHCPDNVNSNVVTAADQPGDSQKLEKLAVPKILALYEIPLPRAFTLEEPSVAVPYNITHDEIRDFGPLEDAREFLGADIASAEPMPPSNAAVRELILDQFPSLNFRDKPTDRFMDYVESSNISLLVRAEPSAAQRSRTLPEMDSDMQSFLKLKSLPKTSTPLQQSTGPLITAPTVGSMIEADIAHLEPLASKAAPPVGVVAPTVVIPRPIQQSHSFARVLPMFENLSTLPPLRTTYQSFNTMIESFESTNNVICKLFPLQQSVSIIQEKITHRRSSLYMRAIENSQARLANEDIGLRQAPELSGQTSLFPMEPTPIMLDELPAAPNTQDSQPSGSQQKISELSLPSSSQPGTAARLPQILPLNTENQIARELFGDTQAEMSLTVGIEHLVNGGRDVAVDGGEDAAAADVDFTVYERIYCTLLCIQAMAATNYVEQIEDPDELTIEQIYTFMNIGTRLQHATLFGNLLMLQSCGFISISQHPITFVLKVTLKF